MVVRPQGVRAIPIFVHGIVRDDIIVCRTATPPSPRDRGGGGYRQPNRQTERQREEGSERETETETGQTEAEREAKSGRQEERQRELSSLRILPASSQG